MLEEKFINCRLGNPLDEVLMGKMEYSKYRGALSEKTEKVLIRPKDNKEMLDLYDEYENALADYEKLCMKESYRLGYEDGIKAGCGQKTKLNCSVLSYDDMVQMIYIYDAIKVMSELCTGISDLYWEDDFKPEHNGIYKRIYEVICNGASAELKLEDEEYPDNVSDILDDKNLSAEERARLLLRL